MPSLRPRQPPLAVPALRELESACTVSLLCDAVTVPTARWAFGAGVSFLLKIPGGGSPGRGGRGEGSGGCRRGMGGED